ncbi:hypothetical protein Z051_08285 [Rhodococcus rhodochrous KG-21]|uniref:Uncharacterized protein n=1 Tax=Rhodococcus rhodochrous KG-21 TaxID=1441923 RepID=A0A0M8PP70_RHORH|nr:hypothetical protein Z051_08285 [Rhodococcus rhodochrous KG-21]
MSYIESAVGLDGELDRRCDLILLADIGTNSAGGSPCVRDRLYHGADSIFFLVGHHYLGALLGGQNRHLAS